jgi:hypothetical protein
MPRMADPQADRLYDMESEFNGWWYMVRSTRHQLKLLAIEVCRYYRVPVPRVVVSRKKEKHDGDCLHGVITLYAKRGDNPGVLLHELAHHITDTFYDEADHHGPEFMAIYMHLLDKWGFLSPKEFRRLARSRRLRVGRRYSPRAFRV